MAIVTLPNGSEFDSDIPYTHQSLETHEFIQEMLSVTGGTETKITLLNGTEAVKSRQYTLSGFTIQENYTLFNEGFWECGDSIACIEVEII